MWPFGMWRRKKERDDKGIAYETKHFHLVDNRWVYKQLRTTPYNPATEKVDEHKLPWGATVDSATDAGLPAGFAALTVDTAKKGGGVEHKAPAAGAAAGAGAGAAKPAGAASANILGL